MRFTGVPSKVSVQNDKEDQLMVVETIGPRGAVRGVALAPEACRPRTRIIPSNAVVSYGGVSLQRPHGYLVLSLKVLITIAMIVLSACIWNVATADVSPKASAELLGTRIFVHQGGKSPVQRLV